MRRDGLWEAENGKVPEAEPAWRLNSARLSLYCAVVEGRLDHPPTAFAVVDFNQGGG